MLSRRSASRPRWPRCSTDCAATHPIRCARWRSSGWPDPDVAVRSNSVAFAVRAYGAGFPDLLRDRAAREPDASVLGAILDAWSQAEGLAPIVSAALAWSAPQRLRFIDHCASRAWPTEPLAPLLAVADAAVDVRFAELGAANRLQLPLAWRLTLVLRWARATRAGVVWGPEVASRARAAHLAREGLADALESLTEEERALARELAAEIEAGAQKACARLGIDVDTLVRYARDELSDETLAKLAALDDDELPHVYGLELLPALRRVVPGA